MKLRVVLPVLFALIAWSGSALAHALLERTVPADGTTLSQAPQSVTLYFDAELEPVFSKLIVKNAEGVQISAGKGEIVAGNSRALTAKLTAKANGVCHVYWNVVSRDGHRAEGEFRFTVK